MSETATTIAEEAVSDDPVPTRTQRMRQRAVRAANASRTPHIGTPVQYGNGDEVVPGILHRPSKTRPGLWDVKVFLTGAMSVVTRTGVPHSEDGTPKSGHWNYIPD